MSTRIRLVAALARARGRRCRGLRAQQTRRASRRAGCAEAERNYDELFHEYLDAARATAAAPPTPDSLWMAGLNGDLRARRLNDLVTVRVVER